MTREQLEQIGKECLKWLLRAAVIPLRAIFCTFEILRDYDNEEN